MTAIKKTVRIIIDNYLLPKIKDVNIELEKYNIGIIDASVFMTNDLPTLYIELNSLINLIPLIKDDLDYEDVYIDFKPILDTINIISTVIYNLVDKDVSMNITDNYDGCLNGYLSY